MSTPALTDLKARLAQAQGEALRDELAARVQALELRLRAHIAAGLPREDFHDWRMAADAAAAAREVLAGLPVESSGSQSPDMAPASFTYP